MSGKFLAVDVSFVEEELDHPEISLLQNQLARLGFRRLGTSREHIVGHPPVFAVCFAAPERLAFASIFISARGSPMLYFFTPFEGGGCVLTARYPRDEERTPNVTKTGAGRYLGDVMIEELEAERDPALALERYGVEWPLAEERWDVVVDAPELVALLEKHAREVQATGKRPYSEWTRESRLRSVREYYELDEAWGSLITPTAQS